MSGRGEGIGAATARAGVAAAMGVVLLASLAWAAAALDRDAPDLRILLGRARPGPMALATASLLASIGFMALRWRSLLRPGPEGRPGPARLWQVLSGGQLLAHIVPGPVAELSQAAFVGRRWRLPVGEVRGAALQGRVIGMVTAAAIGAGAALGLPAAVRAEHAAMIALSAAGTLAVAAVLAGLSLRPEPWSAATRGGLAALAARLRSRGWPGAGILERVVQGIEPFARGLGQAPGGWRGRLGAVGWAMPCHATVVLAIAANCHALGAHPSGAGIAFSYGVVTAAAIAVFLMPGFELGWDAMAAGLLATAGGITLPEALVATALLRVERLGVLAFGALALVAWTGAGLPVARRAEDAEPAPATPLAARG